MSDAKDRQREQFREAVDRKNEEAERKSKDQGAQGVEPVGGVSGDQEDLYEQGRPQDAQSARDKNSRNGKVTADKWNQ
jgi:hypothetical protein